MALSLYDSHNRRGHRGSQPASNPQPGRIMGALSTLSPKTECLRTSLVPCAIPSHASVAAAGPCSPRFLSNHNPLRSNWRQRQPYIVPPPLFL
jgi:hypothetical protein